MGQPSQANSNPDTLTVHDNRTGKTYTIPIEDNAIPAAAFKAIKAPTKPGERPENETEKGLRVQDKGFLNTAVIRSQITYIDGEAGGKARSPLQLSLRIIVV
ncbi:hypothetical protein PHLCEN_2v1268 [Hermanssonia centrifuga]|uniref:Uncharacterized protein n=1 Tax=Hermanssonia centrifuga TaxID=98765 RepID=A0A2R6S3X3_9APHY|nr:hypothetical protein PHLCEN_2v1268 [Hermanssonia centrifuga]